jgi:hypothetical protein
VGQLSKLDCGSCVPPHRDDIEVAFRAPFSGEGKDGFRAMQISERQPGGPAAVKPEGTSAAPRYQKIRPPLRRTRLLESGKCIVAQPIDGKKERAFARRGQDDGSPCTEFVKTSFDRNLAGRSK